MSISNDTSGRKQAVAVRNIEFYRPDADAVPWDLLGRGAATLDVEALKSMLDLDYTRIACRLEPAQTLGIYSMQRLSEQRFEMISFAVVPDYEHQLLGRQLFGHALGLAESKAGREVDLAICADNTRALAVAKRYGFVTIADAVSDSSVTPDTPDTRDTSDTPERLRFELTPE